MYHWSSYPLLVDVRLFYEMLKVPHLCLLQVQLPMLRVQLRTLSKMYVLEDHIFAEVGLLKVVERGR